MGLNRFPVIGAAKALRNTARLLRLGGGTALPGLVVEAVAPDYLDEWTQQLTGGIILVSGTNGKTTTVRMTAEVLLRAGYEPVSNRAGSNLLRGILSALVERSDWQGRLVLGGRGVGLFEVDEGTLPQMLGRLRPHVVVLTNLFRDQLDRYGEVEALARAWRRVLAETPPEVLIANADDPNLAALAEEFPKDVVLFGLESSPFARDQLPHAADARFCPRCNGPLKYEVVYYSHLGKYRCPDCGWERPVPDVAGEIVRTQGVEGLGLLVQFGGGAFEVDLPVGGTYNAYNALAATAVAYAYGVPPRLVRQGLGAFQPAFGRQQVVVFNRRRLITILVKNPAGFNEAISLVLSDGRDEPKNLLIILNDRVNDGRDISWVWDVDFDLLRGRVGLVITSGLRAAEMALRLKYAEVAGTADAPEPIVEPDIRRALDLAVEKTRPGSTLYVLPTYTALLDLQRILARRGLARPYWEA